MKLLLSLQALTLNVLLVFSALFSIQSFADDGGNAQKFRALPFIDMVIGVSDVKENSKKETKILSSKRGNKLTIVSVWDRKSGQALESHKWTFTKMNGDTGETYSGELSKEQIEAFIAKNSVKIDDVGTGLNSDFFSYVNVSEKCPMWISFTPDFKAILDLKADCKLYPF
jgi:hypothetical protein